LKSNTFSEPGSAGCVVTATHQDHLPIIRRRAHLVAEDAEIERSRLWHLLARCPVGVDAIDPQRARVVERDEDELRGNVGRHVDRARRQRDRRTVRGERTARGIDA
jgi:hypothetical protein